MPKSNSFVHPDSRLAPDAGVSYKLRYVGAMAIRVAFKSLDQESRTKISLAAIRRVCEEAGLKLLQPRSVDTGMNSLFAPKSNNRWAMSNVSLTITSQALTVHSLDSNSLLFRHNLPMVSFTCVGDEDAADFICYVAKSADVERMCYVFDCPSGLALEVITTISQAFHLGSMLSTGTRSKNGTPQSPVTHPVTRSPSATFDNFANFGDDVWLFEEPALSASSVDDVNTSGKKQNKPQHTSDHWPSATQDKTPNMTSNVIVKDNSSSPVTVPEHLARLEPVGEPWYVGEMSRLEAERLLRYDGDFLVRKSTQHSSQFVLSGLKDAKHRHLLLADPNGQVRTKERVFDSIQHLIDYHLRSGMPIRSGSNEISLIFPVSKHIFYEI
ncbi:hypothetical protein P879_05188 [Paragonimus westermani]|uniref:SHC-transforming protein 1 n=1 Tax=Paragonimus westermani TaxID=34504 RepID=A0A8T0DJ55_9TREM|nr:hypothetical protein P879_05188 [Paragonimus westermani]